MILRKYPFNVLIFRVWFIDTLSIIYFQLLLYVPKDSHLRSALPSNTRRVSGSVSEGATCPRLSIREFRSKNLFTRISTSPKGNILCTWPRSRSWARSILVRGYFSLSPRPSFPESVCRGRKQFVRLGQRASSAEVLRRRTRGAARFGVLAL